MLIDYSFDSKSAVSYVVQEWRRQRWHHVCSCSDLLTAEREARYRHCQSYEPVRVIRVSECEIVTFH